MTNKALSFLETIWALNRNPVFIKDQNIQKRIASHNKHVTSPWIGYLTILLLPMVIISLMSITKFEVSIDIMRYIFVGTCHLQVIYFCYRSIIHSHDLIIKEKELNTYDNLMTTLMSPQEIVLGKFWQSFYPLAWEVTILFPLFAFIGLALGVTALKLVMTYVFTHIFIAFFSLIGLNLSSRSKSTYSARGSAILAFVLFLIGMPFFGIVISIIISNILGMYKGFESVTIFTTAITQIITSLVNPILNVSVVLLIDKIIMVLPKNNPFLAAVIILHPILSIATYIIIGSIIFRKTVKRIELIPS